MVADADVVSDLAEVVDLDAAGDRRLVQGAAVDARIGADLDVVADPRPPHLRHLDLPLAVEDEAEPVGSDDDPGVQDHAIPHRRAGVEHHARVRDAVGADGRPGADVAAGEDRGARADPGARLDDGPGADRDLRAEDGVRGDEGGLVHARGRQAGRQQPLRGAGERDAGLRDDDHGAVGRLHLRDEHARRPGRGHLREVLPLGVGQRPARRPLQAADGPDFDGAVAMDAPADVIRDFLHGLHGLSRAAARRRGSRRGRALAPAARGPLDCTCAHKIISMRTRATDDQMESRRLR